MAGVGGRLILTGNNTYSGTTTISAGTMDVGAGGTTGTLGTGNVMNNRSLSFNRSDSITVANVISGTGRLIQAGGGTTTLTGANTYTGSTSITAGTLALGAGGSIASTLEVVVSGGGKLHADATTTLDREVRIANGATGIISAATGQTLTLTGSIGLPDTTNLILSTPTEAGTVVMALAGATMSSNGTSVRVAGGTVISGPILVWSLPRSRPSRWMPAPRWI